MTSYVSNFLLLTSFDAADIDDLAFVYERDAVSEFLDLVHVVAREQDGCF